jgi:uncharacterized membrane protein
MRVRLRDRLPFFLILLVGTALRLYRLGADSLWYDETVSVYLAGSPLGELLRHTAGDIHPPGYYILLRSWLVGIGYPTGHADPSGIGLEFATGFFSLAFGIALIALAYSLARSIASRATALAAAAAVAVSPYNIWYSQEARMYTLAAGLGLVAVYALLTGTGLTGRPRKSRRDRFVPWLAYALAAAAGLYVVYYFSFLLLALNLWVLVLLLFRKIQRGCTLPWLLANLAALALYAPWITVAWRQATSPPVPPWRSETGLLSVLRESWTALGLGQSAPSWIWPILLLVLLLYVIGLLSLLRVLEPGKGPTAGLPSVGAPVGFDGARPVAASSLPVATFGSLVLVLLGSAVMTPLYHVRYVFIYSPAFYIVLGAGFIWLWERWKAIAAIVAIIWLAGAGITLRAFWYDPKYRSDDLRGAAAYLGSKWRAGDVVLVNAGYAYPALLTYWQGPVEPLVRLTSRSPVPRSDGSLVGVMTGHLDGDKNLGWGDPRSDFFAISADQATEGIKTLLGQFARVWQYRIYDTVSDPEGRLRATLEQEGQPIEDRVFGGEANTRVQGFISRTGAAWKANQPAVRYLPGMELQWEPLPEEVVAGQTIYAVLLWRADERPASDIATSVRLVGPDGTIWSQPADEQPLGEAFTTSRWPAGQTARQTVALPVPLGTAPGKYTVELVVYDPATGKPWEPDARDVAQTQTPAGLALSQVTIQRPTPSGSALPSIGQFGALALVEAGTPATTVAPGDEIPAELTWQAAETPDEPLVVVLQLLDPEGKVAAGLEAQPLDGRYPTQIWEQGEVVRDRHTLTLPTDLAPGRYRLIAGVYGARDGQRLKTRSGLFTESDAVVIKQIQVR